MTKKDKNEKPREPKDPNERVRMLVERTEVVEDQRAKVCELRDRQDTLDEELKSIKAGFKEKSDALELQERRARRLVSTGKDEAEVKIQDWLTRGNSVIRIRTDTGEPMGDPRKARADELQEQLFKDDEPPIADQQGGDDGFGGAA